LRGCSIPAGYAPPVNNGLAVAIMVASLLAGGACLAAAARDRWLSTWRLAALAVVEVGVLVQTVVAMVRLIAGDRPVELATFVGYLIVTALFLPAAVGLSLLERTRWGSVIAGSAAVVVAVLSLRLLQTWSPLR
jgi:hypothetical protein